jgi:hypothetical protein
VIAKDRTGYLLDWVSRPRFLTRQWHGHNGHQVNGWTSSHVAYVLHALLTRLPRVPPALDPRAREASERRDVISSN